MCGHWPPSEPREARCHVEPRRPLTMYRCRFIGYDGSPYFLHTTDEAKIGPWLAEMFGLFPYRVSTPTNLDIEAINWSHA